MKARTIRKDKVNVITLGCSKNLVDSENIITQLRGNDYHVTHEEEDSDANVIVVNTCGFIDLAKQESIDTILQYAEEKNKGNIEKLYVTGCLSQRYKDSLEEEIPEVDAFFGTMELPSLLAKFEADYKYELLGQRQIATAPHYAYLKISEGCNRTCSFCAIPLMRGKHISRNIDELVAEATNLVKRGVKEIMLIGQELTYYGLDLYKKRALAELLEKLSDIDDGIWIRLHYAYPKMFSMDVIDVMKERNNICNYLDMPLQHASDTILKSMKRQITESETQRLIDDIREKIPNIALRSTFLVGFPNENLQDFQKVCNFVEKNQFSRIGVFMYSHEEGTSAFALKDNIPQNIKAERANELMEIQRKISLNQNLNLIGKTEKIIVDGLESNHYICRTERDSPEVDHIVKVPSNENYMRIGDFAQVQITDADAYELYANVV